MAAVTFHEGARVKQLRKRKGLDLSRLSELTEISTTELATIEAGDRVPDVVQLIRLSCSLGASISEISPGSELAELSETIGRVHSLLKSVTLFGSDRGVWGIDDDRLFPIDFEANDLCLPFTQTDDVHSTNATGTVHLRIQEGSIEIIWDVDRAKHSSLVLLSSLVSELPDSRPAFLHYYKSGWATESFPSLKAAVGRIVTISTLASTHLLAGTTIREADISAVPQVDLFSYGLLSWRSNQSLGAFRETWAADHAIEFHWDGAHLIYDRIGPESEAARFFGSGWRDSALGRPSDETLGDRIYDRQTSSAYRQVLASGRPRFDHVLASIDRGRREWTAYHRLILPWENTLFCLVRLVPLHEIDIPFLKRA